MRFFLLVCLALAGGFLPASASGLAPLDMAAARKIYVAKCAKCHRFYEPRKYQDTDWERWMTSMEDKSKLKPAQSQLLRRYLEEYRAGRIDKIPGSR